MPQATASPHSPGCSTAFVPAAFLLGFRIVSFLACRICVEMPAPAPMRSAQIAACQEIAVALDVGKKRKKKIRMIAADKIPAKEPLLAAFLSPSATILSSSGSFFAPPGSSLLRPKKSQWMENHTMVSGAMNRSTMHSRSCGRAGNAIIGSSN